jgi:hypothetical protein
MKEYSGEAGTDRYAFVGSWIRNLPLAPLILLIWLSNDNDDNSIFFVVSEEYQEYEKLDGSK